MNLQHKLHKYAKKLNRVTDLNKFITYDSKLEYYNSLTGGDLSKIVGNLMKTKENLENTMETHENKFKEIIKKISDLRKNKEGIEKKQGDAGAELEQIKRELILSQDENKRLTGLNTKLKNEIKNNESLTYFFYKCNFFILNSHECYNIQN